MLRRQDIFSVSTRYNDIGLLILRTAIAGSLVLKHGVEKAFDFHTMANNTTKPFPDPIHIGVVPSLFIALLSDFVCGILVILGLGTRWAAAFALANITVAWITVHHFSYFGQRGDHGEIIIMMMGGFLAFILTGPGKYSLDYLVARPRA